MDKEKINEILSITLGILSVLAIIGLLINNNFETNELLSSVINFTQVAVPVLVLIGVKFFSERNYSFLDAGKNALVKLQSHYRNDLEGPKANYQMIEDSEEQDKRNKYLFIKRKNDKLKTKVTFIPLNCLEDGILDIRVSKATLVNNGLEGTEQEITELQNKVKHEILKYLEKTVDPENYEIITPSKKSNSAIIIDFDEKALGKRKFEKIVFECGREALKTILR